MRHAPQPAKRRRRYAARLPAVERREQLLAVAMRIVVGQGYTGLTMEAVAREAGVAKPVVYDSFANRDDIMQTLLAAEEERAVDEILRAIGADIGTATDVGSFVAGALGRALRTIAARPATYRLILTQIDGTPPAVRQRIDQGRATIVARIQEMLAAATRPPDGTPTLDEELLALGIVAVGEQAAILLLSDPGRFTPERFDAMLKALVTVILPVTPIP